MDVTLEVKDEYHVGTQNKRKTGVRQFLWGFLALVVKLTAKSYINIDLRQSVPTQL